jgi:hypothetical protein
LVELVEAGFSREELHRLGVAERVGLDGSIVYSASDLRRAGVEVPGDEEE